MIVDRSKQALDDETSYLVSLSRYETQNLCSGYTLRRHRFEFEANIGCHEARLDWIKYIGPIEEFGGCNPINGNFTALVLPLVKPERVRLLAYIIEYAYMYDNMLDLAESITSDDHNKHGEWTKTNPAPGRMQIEAKIMMQLTSIDKVCAERIMQARRVMLARVDRDKDTCFANLEEYVEFRIIDAGTVWAEALILFGMGVTLSKEEDVLLEPIRKPCFIAASLANDFFSFDREYAELEDSEKLQTITNAVWLHMQWYDVDVDEAKRMTLEATRRYEGQLLKNSAEFRQVNAPVSDKLDRHLDALAYQIGGNVVWSLNCPRYHPTYRYDANAGVEDAMTAEWLPKTLDLDYDTVRRLPGGEEKHDGSSTRSSTDTSLQASKDESSIGSDDISTSPSVSVSSSKSDPKHMAGNDLLDLKHVKAPFDYITSLPSKGVRDTFIDALNIWLNVPEPITCRIKSLGNRLHGASLMLDDVEDGSHLRRGQPATHTVFGTAQTINSGCYEILQAVNEARELGATGLKIVLDELAELHIGQSHDLFWTRHSHCPSEDEYLDMAKKKTGGLFRLLARLLLASANCTSSNVALDTDIQRLTSLVGMQYQIRDDYQNLWSSEYSSQKGWCEDLDEGKMSFPLVHALSSGEDGAVLRELLQRRRDVGCLSDEQKRLVLEQLDCAGSMAYTQETLTRLQRQIDDSLRRIEDGTGRENWILRALLQRLHV